MRRVLLTSLLSLAATQGFAMDSLSDLNWKNRVVLIFGDASDKTVSRQISLLERQKEELAERDMVVIHVSGKSAQTVYGDVPAMDGENLKQDVDVKGDGFHVVLVGKDGGVKLRSEKIVTDVEIFDLVDRMPMRRSEQN